MKKEICDACERVGPTHWFYANEIDLTGNYCKECIFKLKAVVREWKEECRNAPPNSNKFLDRLLGKK